jgi:hypothetical protein
MVKTCPSRASAMSPRANQAHASDMVRPISLKVGTGEGAGPYKHEAIFSAAAALSVAPLTHCLRGVA